MSRVGVSTYGHIHTATVFDLPGCSCPAPSREELRELVPLAIAEHLRWLGQHGEPTDPGDLEIDVEEEVDADGAEGVEGEFVFRDDLRPLTPDEIALAVRWMGYARADLLSLTDGLSDAILDWRPPPSAMARVDPWKPAPLTIREILRDIVGAEAYYRTGLHDGPAHDDEPEHERTDLDLQRRRVVQMLQSLSAADNGRVFAPQRPWQQGSERWTARKVVRRVIEHERFHTAEIQQRLSWLLLGVPRFV